ncbi:type II toxin-antitoxin system RelB/DinJ family antitoxin [Thiomicrospira microaerophila]|uniref:type II toxin-antitoxin system RelB/DinJ family antitoxin n=1 Tax=Thiomicrospira microaerophila TaxID=406020 RepID=UPI0005C817A4|nr:type II toxin-antitoxin system RelB/DinJ family antitoxin [Thiomicrospira microaerophila]
MSSKVLHIRLDENIKNQATETLASMGLSVSEAVRVFLTQVVTQKQIPFDIKAPNEITQQAMQEADNILLAKKARFSSADSLLANLGACRTKPVEAKKSLV